VAGGAVVGSVHLLKPQGYSGPIELVFGEDASGALTGVQVLSHTETPGLGAKITRMPGPASSKAKPGPGRTEEGRPGRRDRRDRRGHDLLAGGHRAVHDAMSGGK